MDNREHIKEASYVGARAARKREASRAKKVQRVVSSLIVVFILSVLIVAGVDMVSATSNAYLICVDGEEIATMVSEREADDALALAVVNEQERVGGGEDFNITYVNDIEIQEISSAGVVYSSMAEAAEMLADYLNFEAEGVALQVDGELAFYVSSAETAIQAVNDAKAHYGTMAEVDVVSVYTREQISIASVSVSMDEVLSVRQATNMLLYGSTSVVAEEEREPMVSVIVERTFSQVEALPFQVIRVDDNTMPRGSEEVMTEGVDGTQEVFYTVIEENGAVLETTQTGANVINAPVDEVVNVGTRLLVSSARSTAGAGELAWPLMDGVGVISSRFGWRSRGWHSGIDVANAIYTTIVAVESGTIITTEYQSGYGNLVVVDHGTGVESWYAHCDQFYVSVGDEVERGQAIACIGMTGTTTGPHVHFEVRIDGTPVDPLPYLGVD